MRRAIALIAGGALILAGGVTGTAIWLSQPSYDDIAADCAAALTERAEGNKAKPSACHGVNEDDYQALVMSAVIDDLGWIDEEGNVDKNEILKDALEATP
ncbi:hypothetical protein [Streptomyces sp. JW3]|uniref:hypothetical protein n=1 Tax=Streptomyces sp. JW3 TaxID=3456955 RepID=UPI003FA47913